jgi:hypothetical protein
LLQGSLIALSLSCVAAATEVSGIAPAVNRVTVLRGGVLLLPLRAEVPGRGWPSSVELRFEDGERIAAEVAWIHARPWSPRRRWSDDASNLAVRAIAPTDDTSAAVDGGAPFAVVALPMGRGGDFTVSDPRGASPDRLSPVRPVWHEPSTLEASWNALAIAAGDDSPRGVLERRDDLALPDPTSPFEHFRWVLMAHRLELHAPPPAGQGVEALVARHGAEMWSIGLSRLAAQSPAVAATCAEALTATVVDGGLRVAAWITDPAEINALLALLLDASKRDRAVMDAALAWADSRDPIVLWPEQDQGSVVAIAVMNTLPRPAELRGAWAGAELEPITRVVEGGRMSSLSFLRPAALARDLLRQRDPQRLPLSLQLQCEGRRRNIQVSPAVLDATPPGVPLPAFRPPLRLFEARAGVQESVSPQRATAGLLRRSRGRWEIFVECGRQPLAPTDRQKVHGDGPQAEGPQEGRENDLLELEPQLAALRANGVPIGQEALVLVIGPRERPVAMLAVPEQGEAWEIGVREEPLGSGGRDAERVSEVDRSGLPKAAFARPAGLPADLEIHRRSLPAVWRCRIVLPESWLPPTNGEGEPRAPILIGMARTHAGEPSIEIAGLPQVPWRPWPAPMAVELDDWDR